MQTKYDFKIKVTSRYKISEQEEYLMEAEQNQNKFHVKTEHRHRKIRHIETDQIPNQQWISIITDRSPNGEVKINSKLQHWIMYPRQFPHLPFNNAITIKIEQRLAIAATDASVKDGKLRGYWIITNLAKISEWENRLYSKLWYYNTPCSREAIILLKLIEILYQKGKHMN